MDAKTSPASRPLRALTQADITNRLVEALAKADGLTGAHCIHELWMRGEMALNIERALERRSDPVHLNDVDAELRRAKGHP